MDPAGILQGIHCDTAKRVPTNADLQIDNRLASEPRNCSRANVLDCDDEAIRHLLEKLNGKRGGR